MLHWINAHLEMLFFGLVPWWLYLVLGVVAAFALFFYLPNKTGMGLGLLAALLISSVGFTARGFSEGTRIERERWETAEAKEKERLKEQLGKSQGDEAERAARAVKGNAELQKEIQDATRFKVGPTDCPAFIPGDAVERLRRIGKLSRSSTGST